MFVLYTHGCFFSFCLCTLLYFLSGSSYVCPTNVFLTFFPEEVDKFYWPENDIFINFIIFSCVVHWPIYFFHFPPAFGQFPYAGCQHGSVCVNWWETSPVCGCNCSAGIK